MASGIQKRIAKDGTLSYRVRIQRRGAPLLSATFPRVTDAVEWQRRQQAALLAQRHFPGRQARLHTVAEAIERYRVEILIHKSAQSRLMQGGHLRWWQQQLGTLALANLTPQHITAARAVLQRTLAPRTVNGYLAALSHVCTIALREWEWLEQHPMIQRVRRLRVPRGRVRFLSEMERDALLAACEESPCQSLYLIVLLAITTGGRKMELLCLRWSHVDLRRKQVTFLDTKNGESRTVPLSGKALVLLQSHARQHQDSIAWVFPNRCQDGPLDIRRAWERVRKQAGLINFVFHDLRHTAASYLAMSGASLAEIAEVLGHKNIAQTMIYTHLVQAHTAAVVERMTEKYLP